MKKLAGLVMLLLLLQSCIRIPSESVSLADALQTEGARMHTLNLSLLDNIFIEKQKAIAKFITDEYAPGAIKNFVSILPDTTNYKADFAKLMLAIQPQIDKRKDSLLTALETQRKKLVDKLNTDYKVFDSAASALKNLLVSAVKIDKEKQALIDKAKSLSNNKIDLSNAESILDKFINSAGSVSGNIVTLNDQINQLIKQ